MERRKDTLRAGATALGVAAGLLTLACTAQTPDGYIHASFGGPLDVFSSSSTDVLSIGDGTNDATELAALLKGPVSPAVAGGITNSPYQPAYQAGVAPSPGAGGTVGAPMREPTAISPLEKNPALMSTKPVVDAQGRVDCTGAVSCLTDPSTNITTVTYADGVIAIVQKINDLTVVAYRTITDVLPDGISSRLPAAPATPPLLAAVSPAPASAPAQSSAAPTPTATQAATSEATSPSIDPGPAAAGTSEVGRRPKINVTAPPSDYSPTTSGTGTTQPSSPPSSSPKLPQKVKEVIGGIVDTVKGVVGKALGPSASTTPEKVGGTAPSGRG